MTPSRFAEHYHPAAAEAAHLTGVDANVILAQWAVETGWGSSALAINHHNLAGIRWYGHAGTVQVGGTRGKAGTGFSGYPSVAAFVLDYAHTLRLSYYDAVRHARTARAQLSALGQSPWDAGHYVLGGLVGGSLISAYSRLPIVTTTSPRRYYSVRPGDTLSRIAAAHRISLARIEALNPQIRNVNLIHPGDRVRVS